MTTKNKKFTVSEFQTWLDGIMEFQESGWSPSPEQWKAIYQKIQNLKEPTTASRKVSIDNDSKDEIVAEILKNIPDLAGVDFDLMINVLNHIATQIRQGTQIGAPAPQNLPAPSHTSEVGGSSSSLRPAPPVEGSNLANLSLSELRRQQGHSPTAPGMQNPQRILEPGEVADDFV